jgi:hypothetical protein
MKEKTISIKCEIDKTEIKETINLIRRLKYEVIELQKQGLASKVINKIFHQKYSKKTQKLFVEKK